jgi:hypothetical protein
MRKMIEHCPGCGGPLTVSRMDCGQCHTRIEGAFRPSAFDHLSPESLAFIELFVRLKGNLKEMERELSVAYSTVRHRLDDVVRELGPASSEQTGRSTAPPVPPAPPVAAPPPVPAAAPVAPATDVADDSATADRRDILNRLDRGEITSEEAVKLLGGESP